MRSIGRRHTGRPQTTWAGVRLVASPVREPERGLLRPTIVKTAARLALLLASGILLAACGDREAASEGTSEVASASPGATTLKTENPQSPATRPTSYPEDNYTFVMSHLCECVDGGARIAITVEDGQPVDARYAQDGSGHQAGEQVSDKHQWLTLNDLIDLANTDKADEVRVVWREGQIYPKAIDLDYNVNSADDEVSYFVYHVSTEVTY